MSQQAIRFEGAFTHDTQQAIQSNFVELYTNSQAPVAMTASGALTSAVNGGKLTVINAAAGLTATLPTALGLGTVYSFFIGTTVTSNNVIIQVNNSTDIIQGPAIQAGATGATTDFFTGAADDTITFNGSTKGGFIGDQITIRDVAAGVFSIESRNKITGTAATPFSSVV